MKSNCKRKKRNVTEKTKFETKTNSNNKVTKKNFVEKDNVMLKNKNGLFLYLQNLKRESNRLDCLQNMDSMGA